MLGLIGLVSWRRSVAKWGCSGAAVMIARRPAARSLAQELLSFF
jgi:hypothetical protein